MTAQPHPLGPTPAAGEPLTAAQIAGGVIVTAGILVARRG